MPFKKHPEFEPPSVLNAKIWRYMDLTKFLSIIDKQALCFTRLDQFSDVDPFEGYYTKLNLQYDEIKFKDMPEAWKQSTGITSEDIYKTLIDSKRIIREMVKYHREVTFVNSWHIKDYESAAMWKLYLSSNEGIAIQSTYERLKKSLDAYEDFEVNIGKIKYIDYEKEAITSRNTLAPFVYKRKSFEHEDELRALIWTPQHGKNDMINPQNNKFKDILGFYVPVDLDELIEKIYVAPNAPKWIVELISSIVKKYYVEKEVRQSDLASGPIY